MAHRPVQPALIIGVGGSGISIVRRFKRRFHTLYPETPYVRLLGIDTDPQSAANPQLPKLSDDEFVHAADFDMTFWVSDEKIDQNPAIRAWWRGYEGLPLRVVMRGAGQRRPIGRLAFFVRYPEVVQRLQQDLRAIFSDEHFQGLPPHYQKAVNIYILASTCGGTGTGMFLDLAYVARHVTAETMPRVTPRVRALLLMPSVFIDTNTVPGGQDRQSLRANAYGALTELDYSMSAGAQLQSVEYPDGRRISRGEAPFRSCYLVGNQAATGAVIQNIEEILEKASVQLMIELASPLTDTGEAGLDNILQRTAEKKDSQGRPRLYSSFSGDWMELPSSRVIVRWTKHYAQRVLDRLRAKGGQLEHAQEALRQLHTAPSYGQLRSLVAGTGLGKYEPQVQAATDAFMDIGPNGEVASTLIQRARVLQDDAVRQIDANRALLTLVSDAAEQIYPEIETQTRTLLVDSSLGDARQFLTQVQAELETWLARSRERSASAADGWLRGFIERIGETKKGLLTSKAQFVQAQQAVVIDSIEAARRAWLEQLRAKVAGQVDDRLPAILVQVRDLRERVDQIGALVDTASVEISRIREPATAPGVAAHTLTDTQIDGAFESPGRLEAMDVAARDALRELLGGSRLKTEEFTERVLEAASHAVRAVAPEFLQQLSIPPEIIADRVNRLSPLAVFTADWSSSQDARMVNELYLVGLPESMDGQQKAVEEKIAAEHRAEVQIVTHQDEERVVMTTQNHGFPLFALAEIQKCRHAFEESDAMTRSLRFILPEENVRSWDILPVGAREARMYFALSLALGNVRKAGQRYIFNAGGTRSVDVPLASDPDPVEARQRARDEFLRAGYGSQLKNLVESRVIEEGNKPLYEQLGAWIQEQEELATDPDYPARFRQEIDLVREYRQSIRPF
jgi:hypothetical protein